MPLAGTWFCSWLNPQLPGQCLANSRPCTSVCRMNPGALCGVRMGCDESSRGAVSEEMSKHRYCRGQAFLTGLGDALGTEDGPGTTWVHAVDFPPELPSQNLGVCTGNCTEESRLPRQGLENYPLGIKIRNL